jgi:HK97 family phage portal protein
VILSNGTQVLAPQAFAETAPQFWPSYFVPRLGMTLETAFASYGQLYRVQPWVFTTVNKVAGSLARLGVNVWDQTPKSGQELDIDSPFARLMADPCPTMPPYAFWGWTASTIEIYGETYWIKLRQGRGRQITGFAPMHPSMTQIFRDIEGAETYRFMGQPNETLSADDVVAFRQFNPDNIMRGVSRLEPLRLTLLNEDSSRRAMASWWKNGARPSGIIHSEHELGTLGRDRIKAAFQSEHQGTGNVGRVVVLEDSVTFTPQQYNAEEMAYIESRKLDREEVCSVMDLPPASVQLMERATFSNVTENMRSLYRDSMAPRVEFIESVVNWEVAREFNGPKVVKFAVAEVLRGAFEQRAAAVSQLVQTLIMKPSEARPLFDLNDAGPDADTLFGQGALAPIDRLVNPPDPYAGYSDNGDGSSGDGSQLALPEGDSSRQGEPSAAAAKHIRDISGLLGRGRTIQAAAREVIGRTGDTGGVREACEYLLERKLPA